MLFCCFIGKLSNNEIGPGHSFRPGFTPSRCQYMLKLLFKLLSKQVSEHALILAVLSCTMNHVELACLMSPRL